MLYVNAFSMLPSRDTLDVSNNGVAIGTFPEEESGHLGNALSRTRRAARQGAVDSAADRFDAVDVRTRLPDPAIVSDGRHSTVSFVQVDAEPPGSTGSPRIVEGVDEFFRVYFQWRASGKLGTAPHLPKLMDTCGRMHVEVMDQMVAEWKQRGVFNSLADNVIARYRRDGTLEEKVRDLKAASPALSQAAAEQRAQADLIAWPDNVSEKRKLFSLLLDANEDLRGAEDEPDEQTPEDDSRCGASRPPAAAAAAA